MKVVVNCRIGSLENRKIVSLDYLRVNCRIGSLESLSSASVPSMPVNCRIGSLEIDVSSGHLWAVS